MTHCIIHMRRPFRERENKNKNKNQVFGQGADYDAFKSIPNYKRSVSNKPPAFEQVEIGVVVVKEEEMSKTNNVPDSRGRRTALRIRIGFRSFAG